MSAQEQLAEIQENVLILLKQNQTISQKMEKFEKENAAKAKSESVSKKRQTLININNEVMQSMQKMIVIRHKLAEDGQTDLMSDVDWFFQTYLFDQLTFNSRQNPESSESEESGKKSVDSKTKSVDSKMTSVYSQPRSVDSKTTSVKRKMQGEISPSNYGPFNGQGKEERLDLHFGQDGDYSALSLRRFVARYKAVKKINMAAKLTGWDKPEYRADKIKLAFQEDVFDYINFESSMSQPWTKDDELIINKLKDRYMSIQAVELSILQFEQRSQGVSE